MHHEIAGMLRVREILQEERRVPVPEIGEMIAGPRELEAEVLIEALRQREIPRRHEGLDLDDRQVAHGRAPLFHWSDMGQRGRAAASWMPGKRPGMTRGVGAGPPSPLAGEGVIAKQ